MEKGFRHFGHDIGEVATLHRDEGVTKRWIRENRFEVEIALNRYPLAVQLSPFYDPKGVRTRGCV